MTNIIDITDLKQSHNDNETYEISFTRVYDLIVANDSMVYDRCYIETTNHGYIQTMYTDDYDDSGIDLMRMDKFLDGYYYYEEK